LHFSSYQETILPQKGARKREKRKVEEIAAGNL
jgi:hypothetical protein